MSAAAAGGRIAVVLVNTGPPLPADEAARAKAAAAGREPVFANLKDIAGVFNR